MSNASFAIDSLPLLAAIAVAGLFFLGWRWKRKFPPPNLGFSNLKDFQIGKKGWRAIWANFPEKLLVGSFLLFLLAFIDPHFLFLKPKPPEAPQKNPNPTEGIAIYFVLDRSGSMVEQIPSSDGRERKIDLLKKVTTEFIKGRPNDLIGLIAFARAAQVLAPLTLNHKAVLEQLSHFAQVGSMDQDGTAIGYALFKAANLIAATKYYSQELEGKGEPAYNIKSYVIILVTDGLQDPNPLDKGKRLRNMDIPDAANYIKEQGIRLYAIIIEPKLSTQEFAPYRHLMERVTTLTGGKFYLIDNSGNLNRIFSDIDKLEKSVLPQTPEQVADHYQYQSLSPYLVAVGLLLLIAAAILETTVLRKAP